MKNYFIHYTEEFPLLVDQVQYTASHLTKDTICWFEPKLYDYLNNTTGERDNDIITIFNSWNKYITELQAAFGDPDKDRSMRAELSKL